VALDNNNSGVPRRLTERQKDIMDFIKNQEDGVTAPAISKAIKKSSRTVLRELEILFKNKFITRQGKTKGVKFFKT
jgi:predicted HTH transcriptional regulator